MDRKNALKGKVVKGVGGKYTVACGGKKYNCFARKKVKFFNDQVMVGDDVEFLKDKGEYTLEKILPRKNRLNRPAVANVDEVFIVLAIQPQPDLLLVDKIIAYCNKNTIPVSLVVNKLDLTDNSFFDSLKTEYQEEVDGIFGVSTYTNEEIPKLLDAIAEKTVCLAGQSAVGKTSLLNSFVPGLDMATGEMSAKTEKGKHTTRHNEIFALDNGGFIVDTAGFSFFDVDDIKSYDLALYFNSLFKLSDKCRFKMCTHTAEPDCEVKKAVENGTLSKSRYERYLALYKELLQKEHDLF